MRKEQLSQDAWAYRLARVAAKMGERSKTLRRGRSEGRRVWKEVAEFGEGSKPVTQSQAVGLQSFRGVVAWGKGSSVLSLLDRQSLWPPEGVS